MLLKTFLAAGLLAAALMPAAASEADTNVKRYSEALEVIFNTGDMAAVETYFAPAMVDHAPWSGHTPDVAGFKAGLAEMRKSFPDIRVAIERTVAQGDMLAAHFRISGTQLGEFMGAPASGKTFNIEAIDIVRMKDGQIAEHWGVIDTATMAGQLGM